MEVISTICLIVQCSEGDTQESLKLTLQSFISQDKRNHHIKILIWYNDCCSQELKDVAIQHTTSNCSEVTAVNSEHPFLCNLPSSLVFLKQFNCTSVLICSCGVCLKPNCLSFLSQKKVEYDDNVVLTAFGFRLFPHTKLENPLKSLKDGLHYKLYNNSDSDRPLHIFTPEFVFINMPILIKISFYCRDTNFTSLGHLWCSYVSEHKLNEDHSIWKIGTDDYVDFGYCQPQQLIPASEKDSQIFHEFYSFIYEHDWPRGITKPLHQIPIEKMVPPTTNTVLPLSIWNNGFGGVNMSSEPASQFDFAVASNYGVKVIRVGAVADAQDLNYLLDPHAKNIEDDSKHLQKVLPRLRQAINKAGSHGLKVIITLTDLPGAPFQSKKSSDFWESGKVRIRAAKFWGLIAEALVDMNDSIMGYDLINEPYTPNSDDDYFTESSLDLTTELNHFYEEAVAAIRQSDIQTVVILTSPRFANPQAIEALRPLKDPYIAYSFHMYTHPHLTLQRQFGNPGYMYPGFIRRWLHCPHITIEITKDTLRSMLQKYVVTWQRKHGIPSSRIFVGEFGICREVPGACQYLQDLLDIFEEFQWSWLLFSFRDEEWDALDYELGSDTRNMLYRSPTELFSTVAKHFH